VLVTLSAANRDGTDGLVPGAWVELLSASANRGDTAGLLLHVAAVDPWSRTVTLAYWPRSADAGPAALSQWIMLRRWDYQARHDLQLDPTSHALKLLPNGVTPTNPNQNDEKSWITLENGIQVWFNTDSKAIYQRGDWWEIPARFTTFGLLDWPCPSGRRGDAHTEVPRRIKKAYAALLAVPNDGTKPIDCRNVADPSIMLIAPPQS
jgi:hypothetical protein